MVLGIVLVISISKASAQDVIVLNNDYFDELRVKVVEVSDSEVKYKKWSYQDGPTFSLSTGKILYIKYQNGERQRFEAQQESAKPAEKESLIPEKSNSSFKKPATEQTASLPEAAKPEEVEESPFAKGHDFIGFDITYFHVEPEEGSAFTLKYDLDYGKYLVNNLYVKGGIGVSSSSSTSRYHSSSLTALNLAGAVGYTLPFSNHVALDFNTGPHLGYTIAGKTKYDGVTTKWKDMEHKEPFGAIWTVGAYLYLWEFRLGFKYAFDLSNSDMGIGKETMWGVHIGWVMEW